MTYGSLTKLVKVLVCASALLDLVGLGSGILEYRFLASLAAETVGGDVQAAAQSNDDRQFWVGMTQLAVFVAVTIASLRWIYMSNRKARELTGAELAFTPAWSVGWFFIPVMNFWKPFQAVSEIWRASTGHDKWQTLGSHPMLGLWWFAHLASWLVGRAAFRLSDKAESIEEIVAANKWTMASDAVSFLGTSTFFAIVYIIARNIAARERGEPPHKEQWE